MGHIKRSHSVWEEPKEFKLERFLNSSIDYKGLDYELLPFGGGRRKCPGISFAVTINELALANLVYKFEFVLSGEKSLDMSENDGVTVSKKFPLHKATPCE
ncbi:hypothetical protein L1987_80080 [Smallanthus sonchifolius]|uniref:Uncharacterized protein n=1 Tax=Smallanthus sonchifolius TaxID=185202 RepID=A0ACB8YM44_9ASTR|nr:hypothetical protein L1987_80080 [Smallanthus sonchifolius]